MKSKIFIPLLLTSLLLFTLVFPAKTCGFYESEADYRAMMFRVLLPGMKSMQPFTYTTYSIYYQPNYESLNTDLDQNDRYRNCQEWLSACGKSVSIEDIYAIQYNTDGDLFLKAHENNEWESDFKNNTFVKFLIRKENKNLLNYMLFAKRMELTEIGSSSRFEEWNDDTQSTSTTRYYNYSFSDDNEKYRIIQNKKELLRVAWEELNKATSEFLKQRYAFQVCRLQYQVGKQSGTEIVDVYAKYFGNVSSKSLMSVWAGLFYAMSCPPSSENRYRYFIRVFSNSDEKKMRSVQLFDDRYNPDSLTQSEQSIALVMTSVKNPGRALDKIRDAYRLDKNNPYIPFLVLREINKLEDWMVTPLFYNKYSITNDNPFQAAYYNEWLENYNKEHPEEQDETATKLQAENFTTDMQYLGEVKALLDEILLQSRGEVKDFYAIGLAHISMLQEDVPGARKYLSMLSKTTNPTIKLQRNLETIWLAIKTQDINSEGFKKVFMENITDLERVSTPGYDNNQMLFTITLSLANEYLKKGNKVYGNLMRMKSNLYIEHGNTWYMEDYRGGDAYPSIEYFDKNANIKDMDQLIALLQKKGKAPFEEYLCNQPLASVNAYKDLKGTLAFRNNDLELAYSVFASMPANYWQSDAFSFATYLNEDPFVPKGIRANKYRKYDFKFSKADFVKELIDLKKQLADAKTKHADDYNKLGDAYFNTSYWGNSWLMLRYGSSQEDKYYSKIEYLPEWMRDYMTAGIALKYYEKALQEAENDEQRAYASLMIYHIHTCCYAFLGANSEELLAFQYGKRFMEYKNTETYRKYECPGIRYFLSPKLPD